ncbi:hypothetical protein PAMP_023861 [Pampus punctatissimus]
MLPLIKSTYCVTEVKGLTDRLLQKQQTDYNEAIENIFSEVSGLEEYSKILNPQLEECAIQLWNWAVTKNVGITISKSQKAKVRHVACSLLYCCEPENPTEGIIRKQILMASKTGRTWLDCKNPQMADNFLRLAVKSLETLYSQLTSRGDSAADVSSSKGDVEKDLLRILSCQAESTVYLSLMCYNFGVDTYNLRKFEDSAFWLSQSYDIGKMNAKYTSGPEVQAKVLRLLATVYFEWDCQRFHEKALNAVSLANKECVSASGQYLKIRILLRCGASDDHIRAGLHEMLESEVSLDVCLSTVKLLMSEDREVLAFEYLKRVDQHFESSPDLGSALVLHIELLLQRGKELLGKQKIEDTITCHYTGKQLTPQALTRLHAMLWDKASKHFEDRNYSEALQWYNYSLSFFKAGQMDSNLAKLQRNRASCFVQLKQLEKGKQAIKEAERCDPDSIFTQFSVYKIAVQENNVEKATEALNAIGRLSKSPLSSEDKLLVSENAASSLLSLAAQIALENEQQDTAMKALESLCEHSRDEAQVLTALRCLVRLVLSTIERSSDGMRNVNLDVLLPYLKMAWNSALQCESSPGRMRDFFVLSYQASALISFDELFNQYLHCALLIAQCAIHSLCPPSPTFNSTLGELTQALEHIQICWEVWKTLKASGSFPKDPTDALLLLYEFEARAKLNDPEVETVLESVLELENVETKVLETIAALAMEPPAHFPLLCKKALRCVHSLIKLQPVIAAITQLAQASHPEVKLTQPLSRKTMRPTGLAVVPGREEQVISILATITAADRTVPWLDFIHVPTCFTNMRISVWYLNQSLDKERRCPDSLSGLLHLPCQLSTYITQKSQCYTEINRPADAARKTRIELYTTN